jgi:low affinity Fe/Cu permease
MAGKASDKRSQPPAQPKPPPKPGAATTGTGTSERQVAPEPGKIRCSPVSAAFSAAALWTSRQCGRASTFAIAVVVIVVWALTGPVFRFSDTWQLVVNTGTTIVTFLMVFLIQNTQNRDMAAVQLKLDELIRVNQVARNRLIDMENLTEEELEELKDAFVKLAGKPQVEA